MDPVGIETVELRFRQRRLGHGFPERPIGQDARDRIRNRLHIADGHDRADLVVNEFHHSRTGRGDGGDARLKRLDDGEGQGLPPRGQKEEVGGPQVEMAGG